MHTKTIWGPNPFQELSKLARNKKILIATFIVTGKVFVMDYYNILLFITMLHTVSNLLFFCVQLIEIWNTEKKTRVKVIILQSWWYIFGSSHKIRVKIGLKTQPCVSIQEDLQWRVNEVFSKNPQNYYFYKNYTITYIYILFKFSTTHTWKGHYSQLILPVRIYYNIVSSIKF